MLDSIDIGRLYENVLINDMRRYGLNEEAIKFGIECMQHVYSGQTSGLKTKRSQIADYTDPAHRCAYLHKYAALHTAMVRDMLSEVINGNFTLFRQLVFSREQFKICSLGGGPGTDVIGALAALHAAFGYFECSSTVVDYMSEWSYSFDSILKELGTGWYGAFGNNISHYLSWQYVGANLLKSFKNEVIEALSTASLVTMIKFTSAAACKDTYSMIRNIFSVMKPGAALLFIDNDGGGFHNLIEDAAAEFEFIPIFGPFRRENYVNSLFRCKKFGYNSCCKTTVTVHVLQKPFRIMDPYMPVNLNFSPPTPFLYLGQSQDFNSNNIPARSPLLPPPSPYVVGTPQPSFVNDRLGYASAYDVRHELSRDENIYNADFISPREAILESPNSYIMPSRVVTPLTTNLVNSPFNTTFRPAIYTPNTQPRAGKRARMQGCFPLRFRNFRHHVANKLNMVKARAQGVFKKNKNKKNKHPITKLLQ